MKPQSLFLQQLLVWQLCVTKTADVFAKYFFCFSLPHLFPNLNREKLLFFQRFVNILWLHSSCIYKPWCSIGCYFTVLKKFILISSRSELVGHTSSRSCVLVRPSFWSIAKWILCAKQTFFYGHFRHVICWVSMAIWMHKIYSVKLREIDRHPIFYVSGGRMEVISVSVWRCICTYECSGAPL